MTAFIYDLIFILPVSALALSAAAAYLTLPEQVMVYGIFAAVILACCFSLKHIRGRLKFLMPGVSLMLLFGIILLQGKENIKPFLQENTWAFWTAGIVCVSYFSGRLIAEKRMIRRIAAFLILAGLIYLMIMGPKPDKTEAALALIMILTVLTDEVQFFWKKSGYTDRKGHLVSIIPFVILLGLAVYFIPAPEKPYDWNFVKVIVQRISDGIKYGNRLLNADKEEYAGAMGFKEKGTYFGNLKVEDEKMMQIETTKEAGRAVYLTGRILDDFDGREWSSDYSDVNEDAAMDAVETMAAILNYDRTHSVDYLKRVKLSITYDEFNTGYYFVPQKTFDIELYNEKEGIVKQGGELKSLKRLGYKTAYDINFLRINNRNSGFRVLYDNASPVDEKSWKNACVAFKGIDPGQVTYQEYKEYVSRVYDIYLPETVISDRASEYLEKLSEGAADDIEVLGRIEKVLSSMKYELSPGELPDSIDSPGAFLDRLLFEKQEGYCTHYATAFVLMARSLGYPARFVQGFLVPLNGRQPYPVMSSMAHAWPEVYIDNVGWIPYEPTPGISYDLSWAFMLRAEDMEEGLGSADPHEGEGEDEILLPEMVSEEAGQINWRAVLLLSAMVAVFLICFILIDRIIRKRRLKNMDAKEKARLYCRYGIRLLSVFGLKLKQGETLSEYRLRADREIFESDDDGEGDIASCLDFITDYETILYSSRPVKEETVMGIIQDIDGLFDVIKEYKGRFRTFFIRFKYVI